MRALWLVGVTLTLSASAPEHGFELELPPPLVTLLATGSWDQTPAAFRIVTLSHLADGCAAQGLAHPARREAALNCVDQALTLARRLTPAPRVDQVPDALFLEHFNLVLGARDALGACADEPLHRAVTERLAGLSLADRFAHAPSYGALRERWPADQSALLASLARYDGAHHAHTLHAPLERFEEVMARPGMVRHGLPVSEVTGASRSSQFPRGCANSFIARYLAEADPKLAHAWWLTYRADFVVEQAGVVGFREWPRGIEGPADGDSGPIIMGIGTAASALAISAARAQGDEALAARLQVCADVVLPLAGPVSSMALAQAILFQSRWQRRVE